MSDGLTVRNLYFSYTGPCILENVNLDIRSGEICALLGQSGSGKTTLIKCLLQLERPDRALVNYCDRTIAYDEPAGKLSSRTINRDLGYVPQSGYLFPHLTTLENLVIVLTEVHQIARDDAVAIAKSALAKVGLGECADTHPWRLSGGQQQRAAIARALAIRPKIFLFDEPTGALDVLNSDIVGQAIREDVRARQSCALITTHNLAFARKHCDSIALLSERKIRWHARANEVEVERALFELG